ncbi:MAG: ORF6N domain-containing protein [Chitinophagales bacterium]
MRNQKVVLDKDLAALYGVTTRRLKEQVRRNISRFPEDFMFLLTRKETNSLRSPFATLKRGTDAKYMPFASSEHGVLMLSSVLNSEQAIQMNTQIMRIFSRMSDVALNNKHILLKLEQFEKKVNKNDDDVQLIFKYVMHILNPPVKPRKRIGFKIKGSE